MAYSREAYQRRKLMKQYYLARWRCFFETGQLFPVDAWKPVWERRCKAIERTTDGQNDNCDTDTN
ncbi:MAG: hypothetical protein KBS74_07565 [Clostridiales bacterium]|nr:hypothetical protein [Candidatus Cacconaster stercorequi]